MDPATFAAELRRKSLRPAYLFSGEEELQKADALEQLRRAVGGERGKVRRFQAGETNAADVIEARRNLSLLDPVAVIVVRQAAKLSESDQEVLRDELSIDAPDDRLPPVVFWDEAFDRRKTLFAALGKASVEFKPMNRRDARAWIEAEGSRRGHRVSSDAAAALVEMIGTDLMKLRSALEQLSLTVGTGKPIDADTVEEVAPGGRSHALYEIQDALVERDGARAVRLFRSVLDEGETPYVLVGVLFAEVRRLAVARELDPRITPEQAAPSLGAPPFKAKRILQNARRFSPAELRRAIDRLADVDVALKGGEGDAVAALEAWLIEVTTPRGPASEARARGPRS